MTVWRALVSELDSSAITRGRAVPLVEFPQHWFVYFCTDGITFFLKPTTKTRVSDVRLPYFLHISQALKAVFKNKKVHRAVCWVVLTEPGPEPLHSCLLHLCNDNKCLDSFLKRFQDYLLVCSKGREVYSTLILLHVGRYLA